MWAIWGFFKYKLPPHLIFDKTDANNIFIFYTKCRNMYKIHRSYAKVTYSPVYASLKLQYCILYTRQFIRTLDVCIGPYSITAIILSILDCQLTSFTYSMLINSFLFAWKAPYSDMDSQGKYCKFVKNTAMVSGLCVF